MKNLRIPLLISGVLSASLVLSACTSMDGPKEQVESSSIPTTDAPSALQSFDAPVKFEGEPVPIKLDGLDANIAGDVTSRFTLAGERAYAVTPDGVGAADLATGEILWKTPFPAAPKDAASVFYSPQGPGAPVVADDGSTVYAVSAVTVEGSGTTADTRVFQLVAIDADSGKIAWHVDVPTPKDLSDTRKIAVEVVSATAERVLIAHRGDGVVDKGSIAAVDPSTKAVLWNRDGVKVATTDDTLVVIAEPDGAPYPQLVGVDLASGKQLWSSGSSPDSAVSGATAVMTERGLVVTRTPYSGSKPTTAIIDARSGKDVEELPDIVLGSPVKDGKRLYDFSDRTVRSLDPASLAVRWELPTDGRVSPRNPVALGGKVYGTVKDQGVVLDGDTGADVSSGIPGIIVEVNEHGALVLQNKKIVFLPATA